MKPEEIINSIFAETLLSSILDKLHEEGPINQEDLETLAYLKYFHAETFSKKEEKLMYLLGLFYKIEEPKDLLSLAYSTFAEAIKLDTGELFTPVQASIRKQIKENRYFSFSAPTSAGKSFLFRQLIKEEQGDIIIVVPSRALIAEYLLAVRELIGDRKDILVLQFIDDINRSKTNRRIFVVTPERASEIFKLSSHFNITLFLYDEAQITLEPVRGTTFDAFVRRSDRSFPSAKKVFAHPFVENPESQLIKHGFHDKAFAFSYRQSTVGKIYLKFDPETENFECFSPFIKNAHHKKNTYRFPEDIVKKKLEDGGSLLVYVSKSSIYDKSFEENFKKYISLCDRVTDPEALRIIDEVEDIIGAAEVGSEMVSLMRRGVVVHHGSVPLNVRFLIEKFTNARYAKICFATSTLIQGVNMPFDIVWIDNMTLQGSDEDKILGLKNLIGRAGRSTNTVSRFDYGYVIIRDSGRRVKTFIDRINIDSRLPEKSLLDQQTDGNIPDDIIEFIDAVKADSLNDEYNLPMSKVERLSTEQTLNMIRVVLDNIYKDGQIMTGSEYKDLSGTKKKILKESLAAIYEASLGRELYTGEKTVLSAAITILLWHIQGKSFRELLALRYGYLTKQKEQRRLKRLFRAGSISQEILDESLNELKIDYSAIPYKLPDSKLRKSPPSRFGDQKVKNFNYDLMVYDTYDFLDKVISFSLADVYIAAFNLFYQIEDDARAKEMVNYFRYGTNDEVEIWLMRYGYTIEEAEMLKGYVLTVDENEIRFNNSIIGETELASLVEKYM
ncbi:MAG: helicase [Owenweeksia sp.]|nr:helicase [Owenweeksia sp.]MBF97422.1 helicase [Owenweeksia sp.]HBF20739.1 helicase [Cryomorphaceae bacterium]|tara:strand:- start:852 stop:3203 length:2352 start_codon:yes stop_codon:yes gene_type:complete